jgi:hypothetical protein
MNKKLTKESKILFRVIKDKLGVDVLSKCRERNVVDGRVICARILRDRGYSLQSIGREMGRDHTTIMHYLSLIEDLAAVDEVMNANYLKCLRTFQLFANDENMDDVSGMSQAQLKKELITLRSQYNVLFLDNKRLKSELDKLNHQEKTYGEVLDVVKSRMRSNDKDLVIRKLHQLFNGL